MKRIRIALAPILIALLMAFALSPVSAEDNLQKPVIQVSTDDERTQNMALNNAVNVQKALGMDNVIIEIVAYGPGLSLLTRQSTVSSRIESLAMMDITFSACGNTMDTIEKKKGKKVELLEGVSVVQAGVVRIMELQAQGCAYVRP